MSSIEIDFFHNIHTEYQAYFLAWFWSRGTGRIQLSKQDVYILHTLKNLLKYTGKIYICNKRVELNITNDEFRQHLCDIGCVANKRCVQHLPIIPHNLMSHFFRGIYDSYGTVSLSKQKYINISVVHDEAFLTEFRDYLYSKLNIETKYYYRYSYTNTMQMIITQNKNAKKFLNWIYQDAYYYLTRKFYKYQEYLKKSV